MVAQIRNIGIAAAVVGVVVMGIVGWWVGGSFGDRAAVPEVVAGETVVERVKVLSADLQADWSDQENPHQGAFGTWSVLQGRVPLSPVENWAGLPNEGLRGWGPEINPVEDYLFICRASATVNLEVLGNPVEVGDVIMHTASAGRGIGSVTWKSPWTGTVSVSGSLWPTRKLGRKNSWQLLLVREGVSRSLAEGELPEDETVTRRKPSAFNVPGLTVREGDALELRVMRAVLEPSQYGDFVAIQFAITQDAPATRAAPVAVVGSAVPVASPVAGKFVGVMLVVVSVLLGLIALLLGVIVILLLRGRGEVGTRLKGNDN